MVMPETSMYFMSLRGREALWLPQWALEPLWVSWREPQPGQLWVSGSGLWGAPTGQNTSWVRRGGMVFVLQLPLGRSETGVMLAVPSSWSQKTP